MFLTYKFRIKDSGAKKHLDRAARAANQIWNFCCQTQRQAQSRWRAGRNSRWPREFELNNLCVGVAREFGLHSDTVNRVCRTFAASRNQTKRCPRFRASKGPKRALGWIPFTQRAVQLDGATIVYLKRKFVFWKSRDIIGAFKDGCFTQDARGRWYVTFRCEIDEPLPTGTGEIGVDLGLKTLAVCSDGTAVPALRHYRRFELQLAKAQRARRGNRIKAIHAKIANTRAYDLHACSTKIARGNKLIVVGNISAGKLAKTRLAKSVLDASWATLRNQLRYKASRHGARYVEADERFTSRTCSDCGAVGGPKGIAGLGIRHWTCPCCGSSHDRDVNAARNILSVGRERPPLEGEIPAT